jgi:lysozyme
MNEFDFLAKNNCISNNYFSLRYIMARPVNPAGQELIKHFEGKKLQAYRCPAGKWTIGYGHTGKDVVDGMIITEAAANAYLAKDLDIAGEGVSENVHVYLNDNQYAALCCFVFNVGIANLVASTLLKRLNQGDYGCVPSELAKWVKAIEPRTNTKVTLVGLVARRGAEGQLWLNSETNPDLAKLLNHTAVAEATSANPDPI